MNDGLRYAVHRSGDGPLPPLLLLHGFTGSRASWNHLLPRLEADRQIITIDLPGHGDTSAPETPARAHFQRVATDLAALFPAPLDVLGYSMGGRLALAFALEHPQHVRRLVLESASPGLADPEERRARQLADEALARRIEENGMAAFVYDWENLPLFASQARLPAAVRANLRQRRLANHPAGLAVSLRGMGTGAQPDLWPRLTDLHCPVLLVVGALDAKFATINRQMQAAIPGSALCIIPDAGHTPNLENPEDYLAQVLAFLGNRPALGS
jgi:2-succinyl-6-hydroxy-2,4-cyclohexadiene-1-carboxylate synthase